MILRHAVKVVGVAKAFGAKRVLVSVTLDVPLGSALNLRGPNGAGKTTLLKILCGLSAADYGSVAILGVSPESARKRGLLGAQFHGSGFHPRMTVEEAVSLVTSFFPDGEHPAAILEAFEFTKIAKRSWGELSLGQRQLLLVAIAFCGRPRVVLLDEPFVALDDTARLLVVQECRKFCNAGGAIVVSSHDRRGLVVPDRTLAAELVEGRADPSAPVRLLAREGARRAVDR